MVKFGFAIAGGLSGVILTVVGFDGNASVQPEGAVDGLRLFFSGLPMFGTIVAMYLMHDYDVDEERANEIRAELERRKNSTKEKSSSSSHGTGKLDQFKDIQLPAINFTNLDGKTDEEISKIFGMHLKNQIYGLCFSPYQEGQNTFDTISAMQVERRMDIVAEHTNWVRSFSCTKGNEHIPVIAHKKGLKTLVGAWLSDDKERNKIEIQNLIELANNGCVNIAAIGNETLLRGELTEEELIGHINEVKSKVGDIPVGYVDTYFEFYNRPALVEACDKILINCYPFWEGSSIETALTDIRKMFIIAQQVANGKEVIIAETGWPSEGYSVEKADANQRNAQQYFIQVQDWLKEEKIPSFYFSSFDESWKAQIEGEVGIRWGLWDKDEKLKYNINLKSLEV